jgi:hypothetical protein
MADVLPSTTAILVLKRFFSAQALLKMGGHVLVTKIDEARVIEQTWSTSLTGRPNRSDQSIWKQNRI